MVEEIDNDLEINLDSDDNGFTEIQRVKKSKDSYKKWVGTSKFLQSLSLDK